MNFQGKNKWRVFWYLFYKFGCVNYYKDAKSFILAGGSIIAEGIKPTFAHVRLDIDL